MKIQELLSKLVLLAHEINEQGNHDVVFELQGYHNCYDCHVYEGGYTRKKDPTYLNTVDDITKENLIETIEKLEKYLEK